MKKQFFGAALLTLSLVALLTSCKKESSTEQPVNAARIAGVVYGDERFLATYQPNGQVKQVELASEFFTQGELVRYQVVYDASQRITSMMGTDGIKIQVLYNAAGFMERTEMRLPDNSLLAVTQFSYQNGRVAQSTMQFALAGRLENFLRFDFSYDANGNPTTVKTSSWAPGDNRWDDFEVLNISYDSRVNPLRDLRQLMLIFWQHTGQNNRLRETHKDAAGQVVEEVFYQYSFRGDGLPAEATVRTETPGQLPTNQRVQYQYR